MRSTPEQLRLLRSPLFDEKWYSLQAGRPLRRRAAVRHYLEVGVAAGHHPHPLFDPAYVRSQMHPDRRRKLGAGDPLGLYLSRGAFHLVTHAAFDTEGYVGRVPAAASHPSGPTAHYVEVGAAAGIAANDWLDGDLRDWVAERRTAAADRLADPAPIADDPSAPDDPARVSAVVVVSGDGAAAIGAVEGLVRQDLDGRELDCLVWDDGTRPEVAAGLDALPMRFPQVQVVHAGRRYGAAQARTRAARLVRGAELLLLHDDLDLPPGALGPLLAPLADTDVLGVQPLVVSEDLLVSSAGYAFPDRGLPHHFLRGFPVHDARRVAHLRFGAVSGAALALRRSQVLEVGGWDGSLEGEIADVDLCVRLARAFGGHFQVATDVVAVHHDNHAADPAEDRARYLASEQPAGDDRALWAAAGFRIVDHDVRSTEPSLPPALRVPQPVLVREARLHADPARTEPRALRWAIKNPAPARSSIWGDTHYADGLADALRALGQEVVIDRQETFERPTARHDDVALVLRGPEPARPTPEHPTLAWVISRPDTVSGEELAGYDAVFAASPGWAERRSREWGVTIEPLLQATDPARFSPGSAAPDTGPEALFVGNTRGEFRPVVRDAIASGLDVTIYGTGWGRFLPAERIAGTYLDNTLLSAAYRSASIVLNDHFDDMRRHGFISNRIFDALASGARVISDDVEGLADLFGGAVQVYRTPEDLRALASRWRDAFPDDDARVELAERVRREHSFGARARVLLAAAHRAVSRRTTP
ncbi:Glycosyltransferase, GT2 family [Nocardioides terrae]|uniref:Glycosyltransferase, GT2 family n=1 Tax=Nocardioides terrae TaxID=574651 RepID=A0A1I1JAV8_9ACTN|nr:glycosyltransferase [Nocardioides terrae]SFC43073.1 Glycosyltransferase, GT2 family [Nocardioides terrae]